MRSILTSAGLALAWLATWAAPAAAQELTMTFRIQSLHPNRVQISFYAQSRNVEWPGGGEAFVLGDSEVHEMPLACQNGERICYGAWLVGDTNTRWGVGVTGREGCRDCCYVCSTNDPEQITLGK